MNSKSAVEAGVGVVVKGIGNVINGEKYEKSLVDEKGNGGLFIKGLTVEAEPFVSSRTYDRFDVKDKTRGNKLLDLWLVYSSPSWNRTREY